MKMKVGKLATYDCKNNKMNYCGIVVIVHLAEFPTVWCVWLAYQHRISCQMSTACHTHVMSAERQVSPRFGTWLLVVLLHITDLGSWSSPDTFGWCKQTAGPVVLYD